VVQDLFFDLWTRRQHLVIEQALTSYLYIAARNRALNVMKRDLRAAAHATELAREPVAHASPGESELLDALEVQDAIAQLPARCRLIFTLNRQQDMSYGEIAASLGLSIKTVETQMGRALKAMRERLRHILS
jgi:RNA polymerase sigma-70 factor, ECF subfamily